MELKQGSTVLTDEGDDAYNRTILELKRDMLPDPVTGLPAYNRTILELKHVITKAIDKGLMLIIAPFWN